MKIPPARTSKMRHCAGEGFPAPRRYASSDRETQRHSEAAAPMLVMPAGSPNPYIAGHIPTDGRGSGAVACPEAWQPAFQLSGSNWKSLPLPRAFLAGGMYENNSRFLARIFRRLGGRCI